VLDQIDSYGLTVNEGKENDSRAAAFIAIYGRLFQVEVEALDPDDLRTLIQTEIDANWDKSEFERVKQRERTERGQLQELADEWTTGDPAGA
jgi:hypothetical protein